MPAPEHPSGVNSACKCPEAPRPQSYSPLFIPHQPYPSFRGHPGSLCLRAFARTDPLPGPFILTNLLPPSLPAFRSRWKSQPCSDALPIDPGSYFFF